MSDNAEIQTKVLAFLSGEFARKEGRQCVGVDLEFAPGNGFKNEEIRKWVRQDDPDLFDSFVHVEKLAAQIVEIAHGEVDAKPPGKHRFVVRTHQHLGGRCLHSFSLSPAYTGSDDVSIVPSGGHGRQDVIANHAGQLMRINAQMFEGTIRVLGQQNMNLHEEVSTLRSENLTLRRENDELKSSKDERDFQYAMAAERNARTNAGFQKLLQIGSVVAAKIGGAEDTGGGGGGGTPSSLTMLIGDFGKSLRKDQIGVLMGTLDMAQKIMFMEIMNMVTPAEAPAAKPAGPTALPPNGAPAP